VTCRSCIERTEGVRAVPNLMPAFQALDRAHTGYVDRQRFALALRKVCNKVVSTVLQLVLEVLFFVNLTGF
jgi:hypothetical protein